MEDGVKYAVMFGTIASSILSRPINKLPKRRPLPVAQPTILYGNAAYVAVNTGALPFPVQMLWATNHDTVDYNTNFSLSIGPE